ncbi:hypothetical protein [Pectobacterium versatile]|uniref:Uncharacterized protein n=1 Tax=Pectobacterium versatile TaxID=2488639 RepID=A0ABU8K5N7_9GAMM|nr:hypothetical protein [Pectobacterium versatile]ASN84440.1 Hypothetical protein SCC1_0979 [Pectobacterium versatile]MBA0173698.1 hypothetical protein [Pectobacterium versatile]MBA0185214.1 hypothetical protein [Pectobacterium versatile]MBQ4764120.1 hypothetical protein [Pectobacterium versatile]MBQ4782588.1 hypothetical protein [Pectobacterium versatile]
MNKRVLILKSGLSARELLRLKNNYLDTKRRAYGKEIKIKDIESFSDYIYFIAYLCWNEMLMLFLMSLGFAIYDYYSHGVAINSMKVFLLIYGIVLVSFMKAKSENYKITMIMMIKLIPIRFFNSFNYLVKF